MTTNTEQAKTGGAIEPMVEALIQDLLEHPPHPKTTKDAIRAALTEELMASLLPSVRSATQASPVEVAILAESLAPVLAEALAPSLAEALAPALVKALGNIVSSRKLEQEKPEQEAGSEKGTDWQQ